MHLQPKRTISPMCWNHSSCAGIGKRRLRSPAPSPNPNSSVLLVSSVPHPTSTCMREVPWRAPWTPWEKGFVSSCLSPPALRSPGLHSQFPPMMTESRAGSLVRHKGTWVPAGSYKQQPKENPTLLIKEQRLGSPVSLPVFSLLEKGKKKKNPKCLKLGNKKCL